MRDDQRPRHPGATLVAGCVSIGCAWLAICFLIGRM